MVAVLALFPKKCSCNSSEYQKALREALKKSNILCALTKKDADDAIKLADSAVLAYKIVADELDYVYMINEHLENRMIVAEEVLSEFE